ncbi:MAG TPA: trypsin-like peptidase domain-containing protein [Candidatus Dormibacteraeota bacterium]|nr:trypsin-like peptidase domain-containing protein [Candidatus Dormibacteraeota bacterium]
MNKRLPLILLSVAVVTAACSVAGLRNSTNPPAGGVSAPVATQAAAPSIQGITGSDALTNFQTELESVATAVLPSIVQVDTAQGLGSGIVYDTNGDIVTNNHVVEGATAFTVKASDGASYSASLVGTYPANDLAVLHVANAGLKPAKFADSAAIKVGEVVLAIGSPFGLSGTVTDGIVSALGRTQSEGNNGVTLSDLVQTSAPINPGNSGGALVDLNGEVVGIPTLAGSDSQGRQSSTGIGFAIPSVQVTTAAHQIVTGGSVTHTGRPYLGVNTRDDATSGADVVAVVSGGPAANGGLQVGMVITAVGAQTVPNTDGLSQALSAYKPGDKVSVQVRLADGSSKTLTVTLGERPANI